MTTSTRVIFVVGAGPGIGLSVARRFAREGFAVGLVARDAERLAAAADDVREAGSPRVEAAAADVGSPEDLRAALTALRLALGEPEVLVSNTSMFVAGGGPVGSAYDDVLAGLRVGVLATLVALQEVAPAMEAAGRGTVVVTGGGLGLVPSVWSSGLSMQKTAVRALALTGFEEMRERGVHVCMVTVDGVVGRGDAFAPDVIAERYWDLAQETVSLPPADWTAEITHH